MKKYESEILNINVMLIIGFISAIIIIPIILNCLLYLPFPLTPWDLSNKDWLSFWGSFLGGCIGGIATLFAVYYTLKQNLVYYHQSIKKQDHKTRIEVLPYIDVRPYSENESIENITLIQFPSGYILFNTNEVTYSAKLSGFSFRTDENGISDFYNTDIPKIKTPLSICNVGMYSAVDVTFELNNSIYKDYAIMPSFNLKEGKTFNLYFIFDKQFPKGEHIFNVKFKNIYGDEYLQNFKLDLDIENKNSSLERITYPVLTKKSF